MTPVVEMCKQLLLAYEQGLLGDTSMPEDSNPGFNKGQLEQKLAYFTLPMALNYQRNSYKLWESALKTFNDKETKSVFDIEWVSKNSEDNLRSKLLKHKLALQPNKHVNTWFRISNTVSKNWGSFSNLFDSMENDFLNLRSTVQKEYKKDFPYLSGPKIFNYWSHIMGEYGGLNLKNTEFIEIAPDTHVVQASIKLGVLTVEESAAMSREAINARWRDLLKGSGITPVEMHSPLWFWSRGGFKYKVRTEY